MGKYEEQAKVNAILRDKNHKLTREELLYNLQKCVDFDFGDEECNHIVADELVLKYIDDEDVQKLWDKIKMWYA